MSGARFVIEARDGGYPSYYTYKSWIDDLSGILLFRILYKPFFVLK